jgi:transposase
VQVVLNAGQQHNGTRTVELLLAVRKASKLPADKAYDINQVLALGAEAVIRSQPRRRADRSVDHLVCYRQCNQVERLRSRLKQFHRLATPYDKLNAHFLAFTQLAATVRWLRNW